METNYYNNLIYLHNHIKKEKEYIPTQILELTNNTL